MQIQINIVNACPQSGQGGIPAALVMDADDLSSVQN
jgi:hypothetical protein